MRLARRKQRGFSLIELIVSMAIVAVLVSLLLPALRLARDA
ncbi:MAG: prepilin-type N-terminal cleavage/methylation domain-containing protein, partial [Planctomycetes bacterium]|nr:prepilin-type N-terminal cleavage/methylation domain-containing protein [Planctomycetota bacterium]